MCQVLGTEMTQTRTLPSRCHHLVRGHTERWRTPEKAPPWQGRGELEGRRVLLGITRHSRKRDQKGRNMWNVQRVPSAWLHLE